MSDVELIVNGLRYGGWKGVSVTRAMETLAGSFDLDVKERWAGQDEAWPIAEEDECRVEIGGEPVLGGCVDRVRLAVAGDARTIRCGGKDKAAALVECSAVLGRSTFKKASVVDIAREVAAPFGVSVSVQPGLALPPPLPKIMVNAGDTPFALIERAASNAGVIVMSDGRGGILITRAGTERASPLVLGGNLRSVSADFKAHDRYHRYRVASQVSGADHSVIRAIGEATDENVRRTDRILTVTSEAGVTADFARLRADWEARRRAARAATVSGEVRGWWQPSGRLWPLNALCYVKAPAVRVDGDMLIVEVTYTVDSQGKLTNLSLMRPDAFTPEPRARVRSSGKGSAWAQVRTGASG